MDLGNGANGTGNFNFLNLNGNGQFRFGQDGIPPSTRMHTRFVRIQVPDINGNLVDLYDIGGGFELEDENFEWVQYIDDDNSFPVIEIKNNDTEDYMVNRNWFSFGNVPSAKLTSYGSEIRETQLYFYNTLEESVTFEPEEGETCFTFNPFRMQSETILDGLCKLTGSSVILTPSNGGEIQNFLPNNFSESFDLFGHGEKITTSNTDINESSWCDRCINVSASYHLPDPEPCGCAEFELTFTLQPCDGAPPECLPLTMVRTIEICCNCDVRSTPPID